MIPCSDTFTDAFLPKPRTPADHARLLRTIAAFANTAGGNLWMGVASDGTVTGLRDPNDFERQLPDLLRDGIQPCLLPSSRPNGSDSTAGPCSASTWRPAR